MRSFQEIVAELKRLKHITTDEDLAVLLGMTRQAFGDRKARESIPFRSIAAFCETEKLSLDALLFGKTAPSPAVPRDIGYVRVDIFHAAGAGSPVSLIEGEPIEELWLRKDLFTNGIVVVKVRGWSMAPTIMDGAFVGVDVNDRRVVSGELYAVWVNGEGALIKRLTVEPGDRVHIISDNTDTKRYPTWVRSFKELDEHFVQGRVKWVLQKV
jgi:phage repressor protein C with HTH and peptisase S24 domain